MSKPIETRCIHDNSDFSYQDANKAVSFPIYQTATFGHIGVGQSTGYDYTRVQNPTRERLEETISAFEGACDTVAFSTGMAAVSACFELFGAGDHIICSEDLYGGATRLLQTIGQKNGLAVDFVDTTDIAQILTLINPHTKALYIETPSNPRVVVENELVYRDGRYAIDFEDFERKIVERQVKLFILCSPHNPVGRVWSLEELQHLGTICHKHHVYVVSDEIHCDFAFPEHPHCVFLKANPILLEQTIVCTAPSKTFNLAGLQVSNIWIPSKKIRTAFLKEIDRSGYSQLNSLGLVACQAAYKSGSDWLNSAAIICAVIWIICVAFWQRISRKSGWWSRTALTLRGWTAPVSV